VPEQAHNTCWEMRPASLQAATIFGPRFLWWAGGKILALTTGAAILQYLAEQVEACGLGDGTALLISVSILSGTFPIMPSIPFNISSVPFYIPFRQTFVLFH
jgi:preprotein translocase subunit SecY